MPIAQIPNCLNNLTCFVFQATSQIQSAGSAAKVMGANVKLAEAMGETAKTMGEVFPQTNL